MSQDGPLTGLDALPGYVIKRAQVAFRVRMDAVLLPLGLTGAQYACLEAIAQRPGGSNADLARSAFVSRQSMNVLLRGLEERELVRRDHAAAEGRAVPTRLTAAGTRLVTRARRLVDVVDAEVSETLGGERDRLVRALTAVAERLEAGAREP